MEKAAKSRAKAGSNAKAATVVGVPAQPVRSAKEAINAMYAQDASKRSLSDYLASSAKEIINAGGRNIDHKSAASMHHHTTSRVAETARPSAAGFLRTAAAAPEVISTDVSGGMDPLAQKAAPMPQKTVTKAAAPAVAPVIQTSLKLGPKKAPTVMRPASQMKRPVSGLNGQKGATALQQLLAKRRMQATQVEQEQIAQKTAEDLRIMQQAVRKATDQGQQAKPTPKRAPRPKTSPRGGLMQDVLPPSRKVDGFSKRSNTAETPVETVHSAGRPADSVKRRFRAAPKGYTARATTQAMAYEGFDETMGMDAEPMAEAPANQPKPPVEIYGMMEDEPTPKGDSRLGVVEDYNPQGDQVSTGIKEQQVAHGSGAAANNDRYALGGQSPFFLKSVSVEKRPLSNNPTKKSLAQSENYLRPVSQESFGGKNVYAAKSPAKKALPTKPTVIIPASRKSRVPLVLLLLLTVILGAAMGAFAYLCFFQYME